MIADLDQKFPDVGHDAIWRMRYIKIVLLCDYSNWIIGKREYHWVLDTFSPLLKEPKSQFYFEDIVKEINARHEASRLYLSKLKSTDPQKDSNQQTS
jgi:hypothetical protein